MICKNCGKEGDHYSATSITHPAFYWCQPMQIVENGIPRRARADLYTPAEAAIREAMLAVEAAGAHPLLTEAVTLLRQAKDKVADFVELPRAAD